MPDEAAERSGDAALAYFAVVVEPTVAEFLLDLADLRRGCLACLALSSMTEHFFYARPELATTTGTKATFKNALRRENASIGWIADVANATKHVRRDGRPEAGIGYSDLQVAQLNRAGVMRAGWPLGGQEVIVGQNGEWRLRDLVDEAMAFWRKKLDVDSPQPADP